MVVLVTGGGGQLGQAFQFVAGAYPGLSLIFADSATVDVTDKSSVTAIFETVKPQFCINAAAYTAVDKAETEPEKAAAVNVNGAKNVAEACSEYGATLIHISTDFVFDGEKTSPYTEEDDTNPIGIYGLTKRDGEMAIGRALKEYFIIRTSWLYSQFAGNFMKTMLRIARERNTVNVVNDQFGTPTHAVDLAKAILQIITIHSAEKNEKLFGTYHFSNEGEASWFDFASKIFEFNKITIDVRPISTAEFPTPAKRPHYSVLDKTKIKSNFGISIRHWEAALRDQ